MTKEQTRLMYAAADLLVVIDRLVPSTTIHYAVEDARRAVEVLLTQAGKVITNDVC